MRMFMNTSVKYCEIFRAKESTSKRNQSNTPNFYGILCALQSNNVNSYFIRILSLSSFPFFDTFHLGLFCRRCCLLNCYTIIQRFCCEGQPRQVDKNAGDGGKKQRNRIPNQYFNLELVDSLETTQIGEVKMFAISF